MARQVGQGRIMENKKKETKEVFSSTPYLAMNYREGGEKNKRRK